MPVESVGSTSDRAPQKQLGSALFRSVWGSPGRLESSQNDIKSHSFMFCRLELLLAGDLFKRVSSDSLQQNSCISKKKERKRKKWMRDSGKESREGENWQTETENQRETGQGIFSLYDLTLHVTCISHSHICFVLFFGCNTQFLPIVFLIFFEIII